MSTPTDDANVTYTPSPEGAVKTLLILGASGDLTGRLLLPGLARLITRGRADGLQLVGAGSDGWSTQDWQGRLADSFAPAQEKADDAGRTALERICQDSTYHPVDVTVEGELAKLLGSLIGPVAIYFALPPAISQKACELLEPDDVPAGTRLVMEKPFGSGEESARRLNKTLKALVPEDHIHRVDHFLGKATVFNILGLRFANRMLEPVWSNQHIEKVEIFFDEKLTVEKRSRYYDKAGALRDMIQSHLLQIMALMAINGPATIHERDLRDHVGSTLRAASIGPDFARCTRRARYTAGLIGDRSVPNYLDEDGIDEQNMTETLAEVEVSINNERWAGVPFILRSGKAVGRTRKEAIVTFKAVNHLPTGFTGTDAPTRLRIGFGPDTLQLEMDVNGPGNIFSLDRAVLSADLNASDLLPYGEVLDGVLSGDPLLSVRDDIAEDCWRIVEPVLEAWANNTVPMEEYEAGSSGPSGWMTSQEDVPLAP